MIAYEDYLENISYNIRKLCKQKKVTQKELAKQTRINKNTIYNYTNQAINISLYNAMLIAEFFDVSVEALCRKKL